MDLSTARPPRWPRGRRKSLFVPVLVWCAFVPCGVIHLYARRWGAGLALLATYVASAALLSAGVELAIWGVIAVIAVDLFGGSEAVLAYNRAEPGSR